MTKNETLRHLRSMLSDMFDARYSGASAVTHSRVQGLADGYMRALTDLEIISDMDLLKVINNERSYSIKRLETYEVYKGMTSPSPHYA